jgi:hypothetical protein
MRPRKFTEAVARERRLQHVRELYPEYEPPTEAPARYDRQAAVDERSRAKRAQAEFEKRTKKETTTLSALAADVLPKLGLSKQQEKELIAELAALLAEVRWEWRSRRGMIPDVSLPVLGGVQPTPGQMHVTLTAGLMHAEKLRDWYRSLPVALLMKATVAFTEGSPALGVVIERLSEVLADLEEQYRPKRGRQPGERAVAQGAARWLVWFMNRHATDASMEQRRSFVFCGMRKLGISCPSLDDDPGDFNAWFDEVEALAQPLIRHSIVE